MDVLSYRDLNDFVQMCIKVEQQLLRKYASFKSYAKRDSKKEKDKPPRKLAKELEKGRGEVSTHNCTGDIKCFKCLGRCHITAQCPTKRTIILMGIDHYSSQEESNTSESENESSQESNGEDAYHTTSKTINLVLTISHKEIIFYTRCNVSKNTFSLIVDSGSCNNYYKH